MTGRWFTDEQLLAMIEVVHAHSGATGHHTEKGGYEYCCATCGAPFGLFDPPSTWEDAMALHVMAELKKLGFTAPPPEVRDPRPDRGATPFGHYPDEQGVRQGAHPLDPTPRPSVPLTGTRGRYHEDINAVRDRIAEVQVHPANSPLVGCTCPDLAHGYSKECPWHWLLAGGINPRHSSPVVAEPLTGRATDDHRPATS